jgi:hypothetical protein
VSEYKPPLIPDLQLNRDRVITESDQTISVNNQRVAIGHPQTKPDPEVQQLEASLPQPRALDTFGGQLIQAYLGGELTSEQVMQHVFDDDNLVMSNLAEMSMGVHALRDEGKYSSTDRQKVLVLEGAMTQFINEKSARGEMMATALEYGTAAALGVVGGVYSNEIIHALKRLWASAPIQGAMQSAQKVYTQAAAVPRGWVESVRNRFSSSSANAAEQVTNKSGELYRRAVGFMTTPADPDARTMKVFNNIYRVINSPHLAKGYRVNPVTADEIASVQGLEFSRTGIPGFRINHEPGREFLVAEMVARGGEREYYRVVGAAIKQIAKDGEEIVVPPAVMTGMIASRLKQWGDNTTALFSQTGNRVVNGVKESRPYKYATVNPTGQRIVQGAAVGVPVSALTLLALTPVETTNITLDDYVKDLETEGINVDRFIEVQRKKATVGRM